jgi:hypothetical protein
MDCTELVGVYCSDVRGVLLFPAVSFPSAFYDHPVVDQSRQQE